MILAFQSTAAKKVLRKVLTSPQLILVHQQSREMSNGNALSPMCSKRCLSYANTNGFQLTGAVVVVDVPSGCNSWLFGEKD
eukprot:scaffold2974_cov56-Attheya_sp.AAC.1